MNTRVRYPRWIAVLVTFGIGLALGGVGVVKLRTDVRRARYQLATIEREIRELQPIVDQLERTEQHLASPGQILQRAQASGFVEVTPADRIVLDPLLARMHPRRPRNNQ